MELLQRWVLLLVLSAFNGAIYNPSQWLFWVIAMAIGVICHPLFKKK